MHSSPRLVLVVLLCASSAVGQEKQPSPAAPKEIDHETLAALKKRDLFQTYLGIYSYAMHEGKREELRDELRDAVPAFSVDLGSNGYGRFVGMPRIGVPFGLSLHLRAPGADSSEIEHLVGQSQLTHVKLGSKFGSADLEAVGALKSLTHLDLSGTRVSGTGLKHVAGLNNLNGTVSRISPTGVVTNNFATNVPTALSLLIDEENGRIFASSWINGTISQFSMTGGAATVLASGFQGPTHMLIQPVPEPSSLVLASASGGLLILIGKWRKKSEVNTLWQARQNRRPDFDEDCDAPWNLNYDVPFKFIGKVEKVTLDWKHIR